MGSLRMLFYVVECFTVNLENLATDAVGSVQLDGIDEHVQRQGGFVAIALGKTPHEVHQIGALHAERTQVGDHVAELGGLVFHGLLEVGEAGAGLFRRGGHAAAQHVQLDFDAEQRLQNAIVEVAGDAAALALDGAGAEVAEEKKIFEGWADMAGDAFEPNQIFTIERAASIEQEHAAGGLSQLIEGDGHQGAKRQLLLRDQRQARNHLERAAIAAVPAEAGAGGDQAVPADGGVEVVEKKAVGAGERQIFGDQPLAFAGLQAPHENAFEVGVAIDEERFFGLEGLGHLLQEQAQRLGEALIHLNGCGDAREKFVLLGGAAAQRAEKSHAAARGERRADKTEPGNDAHPVNFSLDRREHDQNQRQPAGQRKRHAQSPTNARGVANEEIGKPSRHRAGADVHEKAQREQIAGQRQVPGKATEHALKRNRENGEDKIGDQKREGTLGMMSRGVFKKRNQREQNDDGTRVSDLALDVPAVRFVGTHARGRNSYAT